MQSKLENHDAVFIKVLLYKVINWSSKIEKHVLFHVFKYSWTQTVQRNNNKDILILNIGTYVCLLERSESIDTIKEERIKYDISIGTVGSIYISRVLFLLFLGVYIKAGIYCHPGSHASDI